MGASFIKPEKSPKGVLFWRLNARWYGDIALRIRAIREQGRCHSLEFRWATDTDMKEGRQEVTNDCDEERSVDAIDDAVDDDGGQSQRLLGNERREPRKAYVTLGRLGYLGIRGPIAISWHPRALNSWAK